MPNIVEKYIEMRKGCVILITCPIARKVKKLGKHLAKKFKFNYIDAHKHVTHSSFNFIDYTDIMDWTALNNDIESKKQNGVIVCGYAFPKDKIKSIISYHVHLSVNRETYLDYRVKKLEKSNIEQNESYLVQVKTSYYQYKSMLATMIVNKFLKIDDLSNRLIYEKAFDSIIEHIDSIVYKKHINNSNKKNINKKY
jgi:hypothetical protein